MSKVRVAGFSLSLDGFSAGPDQSLTEPLGRRGAELFQWFFPTRSFHAMTGQEGGLINVNDRFAGRSMEGFGAFIIGRNMFGPSRGPWPDVPRDELLHCKLVVPPGSRGAQAVEYGGLIEIWQPKDDLAGSRLLHSFGHTNGLLCRNMPNTLCLWEGHRERGWINERTRFVGIQPHKSEDGVSVTNPEH